MPDRWVRLPQEAAVPPGAPAALQVCAGTEAQTVLPQRSQTKLPPRYLSEERQDLSELTVITDVVTDKIICRGCLTTNIHIIHTQYTYLDYINTVDLLF